LVDSRKRAMSILPSEEVRRQQSTGIGGSNLADALKDALADAVRSIVEFL
jgi:hypothetical protein